MHELWCVAMHTLWLCGHALHIVRSTLKIVSRRSSLRAILAVALPSSWKQPVSQSVPPHETAAATSGGHRLAAAS